MRLSDPDSIFPVPNINTVTYIKPAITRQNIIAGDFSYYAGLNFEAHVTHHYEFNGDGAIIGLNSTVSREIPPCSIAAGNPARIIRRRFDDEMIVLLEKLKWWDKPLAEIRRLIPLLTCPDLEKVKRELKILLDMV
ncbi:MAG: hypothetical protein IJR85_00680 [Synergistaceae bacterium]|nr:hypothetical protein [Synergistaceae bacterium]